MSNVSGPICFALNYLIVFVVFGLRIFVLSAVDRHASSHSESPPYRNEFRNTARIRFALWILFEMYALKIYPGRTAKEIVDTAILAMTGISCSKFT
jgi:hypothetical protein